MQRHHAEEALGDDGEVSLQAQQPSKSKSEVL
jgi:hypothetical protein